MKALLSCLLPLCACTVVQAAAIPGFAPEDKEDGMYLGTSVPDTVADYDLQGHSSHGYTVRMEVRKGKLHFLALTPDKPSWNSYPTMVFKESVVKGINWHKGWPDPERTGAVTADGLVKASQHVPTHLTIYSLETQPDEDFTVKVDGRTIPIYQAECAFHDGKYFFATFDAAAEATVEVASLRSLGDAEILPRNLKLKPESLGGNALRFTAMTPGIYVVEPDGTNAPLFIFANRPDQDVPRPDAAGVVYFGAGVHENVGTITLTDNQTLYLEEGAVVRARIRVDGDNVRIAGRGVICGNDHVRFGGPHVFQATRSNNLRIEGITIRGGYNWTLVLAACNKVDIDNIKICGARVINDDGIDIVNSQNVTIRNSLVYTQDDCIAPKGIHGYHELPIENVLVENCVLWSDNANVLRCGHECSAPAFRDIAFRNCTILYGDSTCTSFNRPGSDVIFYLQASRGTVMERLLFENISIDDPRPDTNVFAATTCKRSTMNWSGKPYPPGQTNKDTAFGHVRDVVVRDLRFTADPTGSYGRYYIEGNAPDNLVENVAFENCTPPAVWDIHAESTGNVTRKP